MIEETAKALSAGKMSSDFNSVDRAGGSDKYADIMGKTARNQMSDKIGTNDEMIEAFNALRKSENFARKMAGEQPLPEYDASAPTTQAAQGDFDEFVRQTEMNKAAVKNSVGQAATVLGTVGTALLGGAVLNKVAGNPAGKIWNKIDPLGKNSSKSFNDIKNYTQEYAQSKEALDKEMGNLRNYQNQRKNLIGKIPTEAPLGLLDKADRVIGSALETGGRIFAGAAFMARPHLILPPPMVQLYCLK